MKRKALAKFLAVTTALSMLAAPISTFASTSEAGTVTGKITSIEYGENYVESAVEATDSYAGGADWKNSPSASSNIVSVTVGDKTYTADTFNGKQGVLTLVVNGKQYDIIDYYESGKELVEGTYSFESTEATDTASGFGKFMNMGGQDTQYTFRQALFVDKDGIVASKTIDSLLDDVTVAADGSSVKDGIIASLGGFFNGIVVDSNDVEIDEVYLELSGDGGDDFSGLAAGVFAKNTANVTLSNSAIHSEGVIRTATSVTDSATLKIDNSVIYAEEGNDTDEEYDMLLVPMMKRTPFALGIEGTIRATNVLGGGQGVYTDSMIVSSGWGVLSTDSGQSGTHALDVSDTVAGIGEIVLLEGAESATDYYAVKELNGYRFGFNATGSGYVAYADSGVYDTFDNVKFISDDYIQIMASNTSSAYYTDSMLFSRRIAAMTQQNAGGTLSFKDSQITVEDTAVQIKSGAANDGYTNVVFDNTNVILGDSHYYGGTLVELVESDDAGNPGNTTFTVDDQGANATYTNTTIEDSNATFSNGEYTGNVWNNIYNKRQALNVTIDNATLSGTISSAVGSHMNQDNEIVENGTVLNAYTHADYRDGNLADYLVIGAQYNTASPEVNNKVNVNLVNGATWNIVLADGTNGKADAIYVGDLTASAGTTISSDTPVTVYYSGALGISEAAVSDNITFVQTTIDTSGAETTEGLIQSTQFYSGTPIEFYAYDENGNALSTDAVSVTGQAFTNYQFSLNVADGYTVESITPNFGTITSGSDQGFDYTYEEDLTAQGNTHIVTVILSSGSSSSSDAKSASKAKLAKKSATVKKGKSVKIQVKNLNGQKVKYSVTKKTKKSGVSVSSKGKVSVKKTAKSGKYKVTVKVKANAEYKAKTLKFTVKVK